MFEGCYKLSSVSPFTKNNVCRTIEYKTFSPKEHQRVVNFGVEFLYYLPVYPKKKSNMQILQSETQYCLFTTLFLESNVLNCFPKCIVLIFYPKNINVKLILSHQMGLLGISSPCHQQSMATRDHSDLNLYFSCLGSF